MNKVSSCLMNNYARQSIAFLRGDGARLWDEAGNEYLDAIAGVAVTNLGHAHPELAAVLAEQAGLLWHTSNLFQLPWQEQLAEKLCTLAGMEKAFFCNSGAEANEAALKLARLHGHRQGIAQPQVIVMDNSFHGRTLATLAATGNPAVQQGFGPLFPGFLRVPYNDLEAVRQLAANSPEIVAVLVEPVQGEGGVRSADAAYLQGLKAVCKQHDWLLMLDEVQTGMGRTGRWFGFQQAGIQPDVITLAKALGNGFPIGACLAHGLAAGLMTPGSHASTFGGNPLACRVACAVIDILQRDGLVERTERLGRQLLAQLQQDLQGHPRVRNIRGLGLMIGIELDAPCTGLVERALQEQRLLITVTRGNTLRLLPPLVCDEPQIHEIGQRVIALLDEQ